MNLFHSARLKLTIFYFGVLVLLCLLLTFGVRFFTNHELSRGDLARRGAVHKLLERFYDPGPQPSSDEVFANAQARQSRVTRQNLNRDFILLDVAVLTAGAVVSYWYAGRTLRPIEAAHEAQKRFTADASHELRTPLASMRLENEVFLRQKQFTETDARQLISSNLEEVARLERLAANLLALNRYEQTALHKTPVSIEEITEDALSRIKRLPQAKKIKFVVTITPFSVLVDRESITELLTILLDNSVKYGPPAGTVVVTGTVQDQHYTLEVRDHGLGIAEKDLPHIFERMYRGDKARSSKISGHGIGLSVAKQIAEANGAQLQAGNHQEGGAVFRLTLPTS